MGLALLHHVSHSQQSSCVRRGAATGVFNMEQKAGIEDHTNTAVLHADTSVVTGHSMSNFTGLRAVPSRRFEQVQSSRLVARGRVYAQTYIHCALVV